MTVRDAQTLRLREPDWSCYAERSDGDAAPEVGSGTVRFSLFLGPVEKTPERAEFVKTLVQGAMVDFYFGSTTLGAPAVSRSFDDDTVMFEAPAAATELSFRQHALPNDTPELSLVETRQYGLARSSADAAIEGTLMIRGSRTLSLGIVFDGKQGDSSKALLIAMARDCQGHDLRGAQLELVDGVTNAPVTVGDAPGLPRGAYVQFALPRPACEFTSAESPAWMLANAPVNATGDAITHRYILRLKGRMRDSDTEPVILGEREVELFADVITRVDSFPRVGSQ